MIINFKDSNNSISFYNIGISKVNSNITAYNENETDKIFSSNNLKNEVKTKTTNSIISLQSYLINSLNYQSEINAFPSTLPDEINIKFTNLNILEKLNPFNKKSVAQTDLSNNTIYFSTEFLTQPKDKFLKEFSDKFNNSQSLIDAVFYHEFAHIISHYHFPQINNIYNQINDKISQKEKNYSSLYQVIRNVEENFSDAYAALLHKEKHNTFDTYHYIAARKSTIYGNTKGFDFNINSLGQSFYKINDIHLTSKPIDEICKQLYIISINSSLEILEKTIKENDKFKQDLKNNLILLNKNKQINESIEELLTEHIENVFQIPSKSMIKNRMMSLRQNFMTSNNKSNKPKLL